MKTAFVMGEHGKIGKAILSHWPKGLTRINFHDFTHKGADYLFVASVSNKSLEFILQNHNLVSQKIIDFSGSTKILALQNHPQITYGLKPWFDPSKKVIALPGCSSWGILGSLSPLLPNLPEVVFADVKFSRSAMQHDSPHLGLSLQIQNLHPFTHYHQEEINLALNSPHLVQMIPCIVDLPSGLSINLFFSPKSGVNYAEEFKAHNLNPRILLTDQIPNLNQIVSSDKILVHITQNSQAVNINIVLDNLVNNRFWQFL